jgi:hypothetical protein
MADERIYLEEHCQQKRLHLATKLLNLNQGDTKVAAFYDQCACIWRQLDELGALLGQAEQAQRENNVCVTFFWLIFGLTLTPCVLRLWRS